MTECTEMKSNVSVWAMLPVKGKEEGGGGGVYSYSADTIEGPRAPPVKLAARHSSLTKVRAVGPDGRFGERQVYYFIV